MSQPLVSIKGLKKYVSDFQLGPLDFTIESGCVVALVGPNGCGKTTLLELMTNLLHPDAGVIQLFGQSYPEAEVAIKQKWCFVPDRPIGYEDYKANALAPFIAPWYPSWNETTFHELTDRLKIDPHKRFNRLSRGKQKALAFAVSLASEPDLLLLDEPTSGLDLFAKRMMIDAIVHFMENEQRSVLLTTHISEDVYRLADIIALMDDGKLLGVFEKDTLLNEWKSRWLEQMPTDVATIPGVVQTSEGHPAQLVTRAWREPDKHWTTGESRCYNRSP